MVCRSARLTRTYTHTNIQYKQEIVVIYPMLSPPTLTAQASNRVCNALALLQCVASHSETRGLFLQGAYIKFWTH